jgi:hypothetical protein
VYRPAARHQNAAVAILQQVLITQSAGRYAVAEPNLFGCRVNNIEEGRIYFWIKKKPKDIFSSKVFFFVLQERTSSTYYISNTFKLKNFNENYDPDYIVSNQYRSDYLEDLDELTEKINKGSFEEISQHEIIQLLTDSKIEKLLTSSPLFSIYTQELGFDVYDNMIQTWVWSYEEPCMKYVTSFFSDKEAQIKYLKKALKLQSKSYQHSTVKANEISECFDIIRNAQNANQRYLSILQKRVNLLNNYPVIKRLLTPYNLQTLLLTSNLNVIEGDWHVSGNLTLDATKESLVITGDLSVDGTLYLGKKECRENVLIVIGDVLVENYIHQGSTFGSTTFCKNLNVNNITYLPAASRTWMITINGSINTKHLIHGQTRTIEQDKIFLNKTSAIK